MARRSLPPDLLDRKDPYLEKNGWRARRARLYIAAAVVVDPASNCPLFGSGDARRTRGARSFAFTNLRSREGAAAVAHLIATHGSLAGRIRPYCGNLRICNGVHAMFGA
jgi:hypothetical protein